MIAVSASFLCSALLGLRLTVFGFIPVMLAAAIAVFALQGAVAGILALIIMQGGYVSGILLRTLPPARTLRPAVSRAAMSRAAMRQPPLD